MTEVYTGADDPEIASFHYWNPEVQQDPEPIFDKMREKCPVAHSDKFGGFWILTKYEDVFRAYQETDLFSSYPNPIPPNGLASDRPVIPVEIDGEDHARYRQILQPLFTMRRLKPIDERILLHTTNLIDEIIERGECEYVRDFAQLLPARIFLEMMGWPWEDAPKFLDWTEVLLHDATEDPEESAQIKEDTALELVSYFAEELDRREEIGPPAEGEDADFIDWLRAASFGGERPLTQFEIIDCIFILLLAGLDTVQGVLGLSMEFLAVNEDYRQELIDHPERLDSAVEELLRWFAPVLPGRRLTRDVEIRGVQMHKEDRVLLAMGSACKDPDQFDNASVVDFQRNPNRHIAFGAGAHRCLGSHVARQELRISIGEWLTRIPKFGVKEGTEIKRHLGPIRAVTQLHLELH